MRCARTEAKLVHDRIIHRDNEEQHPPLKEIYSRLEKVKGLLTAKAYREYFIIHNHAEQTNKGDGSND
ncbi:hypothetical protein SPSYN_03101 [Sporotomaculum syntrophicum]|uniref:Uncharacterized protein n=1 Tax=Sporotomaculum syntrophicum TaxID=182264 RepID=A0A9D2WNJ3_9FIRM|nr:hypothetical protein [Sporotomaculum syntrophicum]KAF1083752.1 hypothetical protein SPSYN_03101 [Sporotomaculum syntrophicum]